MYQIEIVRFLSHNFTMRESERFQSVVKNFRRHGSKVAVAAALGVFVLPSIRMVSQDRVEPNTGSVVVRDGVLPPDENLKPRKPNKSLGEKS